MQNKSKKAASNILKRGYHIQNIHFIIIIKLVLDVESLWQSSIFIFVSTTLSINEQTSHHFVETCNFPVNLFGWALHNVTYDNIRKAESGYVHARMHCNLGIALASLQATTCDQMEGCCK